MSDTRHIEQLLQLADLLPHPPSPDCCLGQTTGPGADLIPGLLHAWRVAHQRAPGAVSRRRAQRMVTWFESQVHHGARLTWGLPTCHPQEVSQWLGPRLAWWPQGIPRGNLVGLVSSRLGRALDLRSDWFAVLRAACAKLDDTHDILLSPASTATAPYVERCADLFGLRLLRVIIPNQPHASCSGWLRHIRQLSVQDCSAQHGTQVFVSPALKTEPAGQAEDELSLLPLADRLVVAASDRLVVLHLRRHGNLHRLIHARLSRQTWPMGSVLVAMGEQLIDARLAGQLLAMGAVGWVVFRSPGSGSPHDTRSVHGAGEPCAPGGPGCGIVCLPDAAAWPYLTHCTRRQWGPWPEQPEQAYLDDLILQRGDGDRSALSTLKRIITQRRLLASARTIRGATPVVSFTSIPVAQLHHLRVFRPHRGCWDFLPYGILHPAPLVGASRHAARPLCGRCPMGRFARGGAAVFPGERHPVDTRPSGRGLDGRAGMATRGRSVARAAARQCRPGVRALAAGSPAAAPVQSLAGGRGAIVAEFVRIRGDCTPNVGFMLGWVAGSTLGDRLAPCAGLALRGCSFDMP